MKSKRAVTMLVLSLLAGLMSVVLAARWLGSQNASGPTVVVVSRDVDLGTQLIGSMLETVPWPSGSLPKGAFEDVKKLEGRVLVTALTRGEPVLDAKLAPEGTRGGLSAVIPQGRRAITVKVNEVIGVAGFALPGNHVDVMVNMQDDAQKPVSKIVLEKILVLAVAQEASRDDTKPKVVNAVTLEVTPEQAERLDLARSVGSLSLVLRNQIDQDSPSTAGIRKAELLGQAPEPAPAPKPVAAAPAPAKPRPRPVAAQPAPAPVASVAAPTRVEVIRGVQRSDAEL